MFTTLLLRYWKPLAFVVMVAGLFAFGKLEQIEKDKWQQRAMAMKAENLALGKFLDEQNAGIAKLKAVQAKALADAQAQAKAAQARASKVEVKWRTQYVPVKVPTECHAAVAAGAQNAAQTGKLFMQP